jgi:hypothetical protein
MTTSDHEQEKSSPSTWHRTVVPILASIVGTLIVLFPSNPGNMTLPSRDSGVFLYVGWRLLNGDIPYRDVWDHKPPLIYFVDALGLSLTPESVWGVWSLQFIFIFLALLLIYKSLDTQFGFPAAFAGSIVFTSGILTVIENGNVTEEYALLFQALCLWLFIRAWRNDFPIQASFWIGLCGGLAFNFKQTTIALWVTYFLLLIVIRLRQRKLPFKDLLSMLAGWLVPILILVIYLAGQNALADFWEQAFLYNFVYIDKHEGIRRLIPVFLKGFLYLSNGWVLFLAASGWVAGLGCLWFGRKDLFKPNHSLILIAVVSLPVEILLITISGRSIIHYYLTPLPVMAILAGTSLYSIPSLIAKIPRPDAPMIQKWIPGVLLAVVIFGQLGQVIYYPQYVREMSRNEYVAVIDFILKNTRQSDKVLLIGAESVVNFLTRREAPTEYVYQYPLALLGRRPMFEEYINQILKNKPLLIVDTRGRARLDEKLYEPLQKRSKIVRDGVQYLGENYQQVAKFGEWFVYRLKGK